MFQDPDDQDPIQFSLSQEDFDGEEPDPRPLARKKSSILSSPTTSSPSSALSSTPNATTRRLPFPLTQNKKSPNKPTQSASPSQSQGGVFPAVVASRSGLFFLVSFRLHFSFHPRLALTLPSIAALSKKKASQPRPLSQSSTQSKGRASAPSSAVKPKKRKRVDMETSDLDPDSARGMEIAQDHRDQVEQQLVKVKKGMF